MNNNKKNNKIIGRLGEDQACEYIKKLGWKILARNYKYSRFAEIDIIAKDKDTIVFVEVKTRTTTKYGHPLEAINQNKLKNIFQAGLKFLQETNEKHKNYRIDVIAITKNNAQEIEHIKNIGFN